MTATGRLAGSAMRRLQRARELANELRGNAALHRLALETVFVLEDVAFTLEQASAADTATAAWLSQITRRNH